MSKNSSNSSHRKVLVAGFVFILLNLALIFVAFGPLLGSLRSLDAAIKDRRATLQEYMSRANDSAQAQASLANIKTDQSLVESFLLKPSDVLKFITQLENNARLANVTQELSLLPPDPKAPEPSLGLTISAQGDFKSLFKYLQLLERLPFYLSIKDLSVDSLAQANSQMPYQKMIISLEIVSTAPITNL